MDFEDVVRRIDIFMKTEFEGGRHEKRIEKLDKEWFKMMDFNSDLKTEDQEIFDIIEDEKVRQLE